VRARFDWDGTAYWIEGTLRGVNWGPWLAIGQMMIRDSIKSPASDLMEIESHVPGRPPEPEGDVLVLDGGTDTVYRRYLFGPGWVQPSGNDDDRRTYVWEKIPFKGPVWVYHRESGSE
jgi:hypothetical protein